jgi:hypothetical protein
MGWEGIHLYDFHLRAARYGSWELAASSPDITLAALRLRKGARFIYEYDLNTPWRHEVRIEDRFEPDARKTYPVCTGGDGACPPEDYSAGSHRRCRQCGQLVLHRVLQGQTPQPTHAPRLCARVQPVLRLVRKSRPDPHDHLADRRGGLD